MNIGEKIKMLRTQKLMTQSELAGKEITRNMLSRIENGAAQPSLDTLRYIAERLNVSAGFLLADEADESIYFKHTGMTEIKAAYLMGNYRICLDMCRRYAVTDDEIGLILAECNLELAIEEFDQGRLRAACEYFDAAVESCAGTVYNTAHIVSVAAAYFRYMRKISATLGSNVIDENEQRIWSAFTNDFCVYAHAFLAESENEAVIELPCGAPYALHVEATRHMKNSDFPKAYECLHQMFIIDESIPKPMMYLVFCDFEICCREVGDFKGAYEYSNNKLELLQKLLS